MEDIGQVWKAPFSVETVFDDHEIKFVGVTIPFTTYSLPS